MYEVQETEKDVFYVSRLNMLFYTAVFGALAVFCGYMAVTGTSVNGFPGQIPIPGSQSQIGALLAVFIFFIATVFFAALFFDHAKHAISSGPVLIINTAGLWHDLIPGCGDHGHNIRWEEVEGVDLKRKTVRTHPQYKIVLNFKGGDVDRRQRMASCFDAAHVEGSRESIFAAVKRHTPEHVTIGPGLK